MAGPCARAHSTGERRGAGPQGTHRTKSSQPHCHASRTSAHCRCVSAPCRMWLAASSKRRGHADATERHDGTSRWAVGTLSALGRLANMPYPEATKCLEHCWALFTDRSRRRSLARTNRRVGTSFFHTAPCDDGVPRRRSFAGEAAEPVLYRNVAAASERRRLWSRTVSRAFASCHQETGWGGTCLHSCGTGVHQDDEGDARGTPGGAYPQCREEECRGHYLSLGAEGGKGRAGDVHRPGGGLWEVGRFSSSLPP